MNVLIENWPWLSAMSVLIACSAFFSGSEAALFSLRWRDRRELSKGGTSHRLAAQLLADPDRLLSAVLLWNLAINMTYFGIASIVGLQLERRVGGSSAGVFVTVSLLAIIFFSEMLPKSLAVLSSRLISSLVSIPLALCVRLLDPLMPTLRLISLLSRRLIWPGFKPEKYLEISDLERAIEMSTQDEHLIAQEEAVLSNIVMLSDIPAHEWMRPRTQFVAFHPPVSLPDLDGRITPSGYLLITERDSEEVAGAVNLKRLCRLPGNDLEQLAQPVFYVPWCATVSDVLQEMKQGEREVAAVVNELGETIGILTFEDILDTVFRPNPSRSDRLLDREPIQQVADNIWHVTGMTSLRRLGRYFEVELPERQSATVAGLLQDELQRLARTGDEVDWGPFHFRVLDSSKVGESHIELTHGNTEGSE
jgi:CBS domain containing-hemolysin-like protein